ncbi:photosynthetic complex assembly protein PuhC [Ideonella sp. A 288]|uniref:photosynthetic complex assembly protein PuhC n=1 Tax=Ideonella sp. A 288 TaxID=1962181 RepID=UPI000B4C1286|nr:photosynthetic complex assembly protein PuhC [Ideonella sp. A 288]
MSTHSHAMAVPRAPLIGAALLVGATLLAVAAIRLSGMDIASRSEAVVVAERELRFEDRPDGSVLVLDAKLSDPGAAPLRVIDPGSHGFLRGALRALVRSRRLAGLGPETPFRLSAHADGRLTLDDPATGERVDLESFGPVNAAAFAQLLPAPRPAAAPR